jgi:cytochrome P450
MSETAARAATCPYSPFPVADRDDRKSAAIAATRAIPADGTEPLGEYSLIRGILRNGELKQGGMGGEWPVKDPMHAPVFFLDGPLHKQKRGTIARFFTPRAISEHHRAVMEATTDRLLAGLRQNGQFVLDDASWALAVEVAAHIVGLTETDMDALAGRLNAVFANTELYGMPPLRRFFAGLRQKVRVLKFHWKDLRPAIKARREHPKADIISHLIAENYPEPVILMECMTYAAAGMATTREFITMVAWHLFERDDLRARWLGESEDGQLAMLEEILRIEPVATFLYRKAGASVPPALAARLEPNTNYALDVRAANVDSAAAGACPFAIDPDRASKTGEPGAYLSFGDGAHRCPGAQVALQETRVFIDRLFRVPGVRLKQAPTIGWNDQLMSYELRGALVACDRA